FCQQRLIKNPFALHSQNCLCDQDSTFLLAMSRRTGTWLLKGNGASCCELVTKRV
ncbi:uncharacterized protein METZ01_LOCUS470059, partial [marine metagenome]